MHPAAPARSLAGGGLPVHLRHTPRMAHNPPDQHSQLVAEPGHPSEAAGVPSPGVTEPGNGAAGTPASNPKNNPNDTSGIATTKIFPRHNQ